MKIALLGYGKMGKVIEKIALERGHTISLKVTSENADFTTNDLAETDVAIDFSVPSGVVANIYKCFEAGVPIVVGTTGWDEEYEQVRKDLDNSRNALFFAPNFSIGVNIFFAVNQYLAKLMNPQDQYDVEVDETHHTQKLDAPSGTAIRLARDIVAGLDRKDQWVKGEGETSKDLTIRSHRIEDVPGTHVIQYDSEIDTVTIEHKAKTRRGFALGSVLAAEWVKDRTGYFTMQDMLGF